MKKITLLLVAIFLIMGGYFFIQNQNEKKETDSNNSETNIIRDDTLGFQFEYKDDEDGYITLEDNNSTDSNFLTGITLFNKAEYEIFKQSTDAREGPTSINIRVYSNNNKLHAPVWAMRHPLESNIKLALGETEERVVGGANAEFYIVDGLYLTDTYVVANGEHIYVLTGSYLSTEDIIYKDFQNLVKSFTFLAPADVQNKIDIQVACESALIYMTFPSSIEADAFIEACVEGKHPEVIDRYIKDLGLDEATI